MAFPWANLAATEERLNEGRRVTLRAEISSVAVARNTYLILLSTLTSSKSTQASLLVAQPRASTCQAEGVADLERPMLTLLIMRGWTLASRILRNTGKRMECHSVLSGLWVHQSRRWPLSLKGSKKRETSSKSFTR
jgi:hypothetical protein